MNSWYHNIFRFRIAKIEYVIDHLFFVRFDDTAFVADTYDRTEFGFCHLFISGIRIDVKNAENDIRQRIDDKYKWCHDFDVQIYGRSITKRHLFRMQCSHGLWRNLSEENDQYRQNCTCHCYHRPAKIVSQGGSKGSGGKIHHIITDQDRTQHLAGIIGNMHNGFCTLAAFVGKTADTHSVYRC